MWRSRGWRAGDAICCIDRGGETVDKRARTNWSGAMPFHINAVDTSGALSLHRENAAAAIKKANELLADGCWDVEIIAPDGRAYPATALAQLEAEQS
jgi:hypothetical protein